MTKGCLLFAHDNSDIQYSTCAGIAAKLINKNLQVPVSLVTDEETYANFERRFTSRPFDRVIFVDKETPANLRRLRDDQGTANNIVWYNGNRNSAWDVSPYDQTLVLDVDMLVLSDRLNQYWSTPYSFLISPGMNEPTAEIGPRDYNVDPYTISMMWATTMMFTKNKETEIFFDLVSHIKENYNFYSGLYRFEHQLYRNDYVFSIACHIMSGGYNDPWQGFLPVPVLVKETDKLHTIKDNDLTFLVRNFSKRSDTIIRYQRQDIHFMNKWNMVERAKDFLSLAK